MKQTTKVSLVKKAGDVLVKLGASPEQMDTYYNAHYVKKASCLPDIHVRPLLNVFWVVQLSSIPNNTMNARFSLINDGTDEDWLRLFKSEVAPVIISYGLPKGD